MEAPPFFYSLYVSLQISDFLHSDNSMDPIVIDEAMACMTKVARMSLSAPGKKGISKDVSLGLLLSTNYLYDIGKIVCKAVDNGEVKSVDLELPTVKSFADCYEMDMLQHAKDIICFFDATAPLFQHLARLHIHNARFSELQMNRLLNSCEQLQQLVLNNCDTGDESVLKIDMPHSNISYLKLRSCCFEKVEFLCLPKLSELHYELWYSLNTPFSFGIVPCLKEVRLVCSIAYYQSGHNLSELLHGIEELHVLTLDFQGEKVWMLQEGQKLHTSFKNLNKLFIHGIYVRFGLLWTKKLLDAAPSLKTFGIKVWDHVCDDNSEETRSLYAKRTNPWEKNYKLNGSRHLHLTKLEFGGFMAVKKHLQFVRAIIEHAPGLETILLEDKDPCKQCDEVSNNLTCSSTGSMFPRNKCEQDTIRSQLGIGASCSAHIIFK
ncbi:hypothetical protein HU200_025478 [Digitaria exilis]|uniref:At1g61320/AtMIF1 LRR domain-containing protein n=1 Tax=Digitaria exilis TaxID=1010633 RepID=A0A835C8H1_9POAL|nr:hypothetical protein HU200_025478 [Digitaria exilis]